MTLVVRTTSDPLGMTKPVVAAIRAIDPTQPVFGIQTMDDVVRGSVANQRLYLGLLSTFAGIALALAVAGIYGVMSYGVSQRTREFGIRLALGSSTDRVKRLVVWQGARLALTRLAIGLPSAFLLAKLLESVLYGVSPNDPLTFAAVALVLAVVSVVAELSAGAAHDRSRSDCGDARRVTAISILGWMIPRIRIDPLLERGKGRKRR